MAAPTPRGRRAGLLPLAALLAAAACGKIAGTEIAQRILDRYRSASGAKPLASAQVIRLRLTGPNGARGLAEISWQGSDFRERRETGGLVTVRGLQGGKAFYTDEDGVTRVASEPVLRELVTRLYVWRRAFLFRDHDKEPVSLGPADETTASVRFGLRWGNPLQLVFSRRDGALAAVRSPRFRLEYESPTRFKDLSNPEAPVETEIVWTGLPTGPLEGVSAGGWKAAFREAFAEFPLEMNGGGPVVAASIAGVPARVRLDASAGSLLRVSPEIARKTRLVFSPDVLGRQVAGPCELRFDGLVFPSVHLELAPAGWSGADAALGGPIFRETVVELDPRASRLRFHDPAVWPIPEGFQRFLIDDDADFPVAPMHRGAKDLRLVLGAADPGGGIVLAPESARRVDLARDEPEARDLGWSSHRFPSVRVSIGTAPRSPDWGDDGTIAWQPFLDYRAFIDMPRRWIYLARLEAAVTSSAASSPPSQPPKPPRPGPGEQARPRP